MFASSMVAWSRARESRIDFALHRARQRQRWLHGGAALAVALSVTLTAATRAKADIPPHEAVQGAAIGTAEVKGPALGGGAFREFAWEELGRMSWEAGTYDVRFQVPAQDGIEGVELPVCAGRGRVALDGKAVPVADGPAVVAIPRDGARHSLSMRIKVGVYEHRVACGSPPRAGRVVSTREGLGVLSFASPSTDLGGGRAVVFVPAGHDVAKPGPLLVGTHPWNGDMWTYAHYVELLNEAQERDVVLLLPSGLGNSLYTAAAEDEVLRALDAASREVAVDPRAVSLWGASMGGAGATTIGFHHPDRFATVVSFFGDSRYDLTTYVHTLLPNDATARTVNALDVLENARHLPVWLIHGEKDATSPIRQSTMLFEAMRDRGFHVRFDRVPNIGHDGALVARFVAEIVALAASARVPDAVSRVSYRSVRPVDLGAYGVHIEKSASNADAFVDVERREDGVHVRAATGVRVLTLARDTFGLAPDEPLPPIVFDAPGATGAPSVQTRWAQPAPTP